MGSAIYYLSSSHSETGMVIIDASVETREELAANSGWPAKNAGKNRLGNSASCKDDSRIAPYIGFLFFIPQSTIINLQFVY
jgi:hypothetical protein